MQMGSPLAEEHMLALILYCNGDCNYNLSKCHRNGDCNYNISNKMAFI